MTSLELLQLPDVVLSKIISFVPERSEIANVCRRFYEIICDFERSKCQMTVGSYKWEDSSLASIMNTKRVCQKLNVRWDVDTAQKADELKQIFKLHGHAIKSLNWSNDVTFVYDEATLVEMLNCFPNLEELELKTWEGDVANSPAATSSLMLPKLKKLILERCNDQIGNILTKHLPSNILTSLYIRNCTISIDNLRKFTKNQEKVTSFGADGSFDSGDFLDGLKLVNLDLHLSKPYGEDAAPLRIVLRNLIKSQSNLKYLDVLQDDDYSFKIVDDDVFLEICKIKSLEELKVNFSGVHPSCIQNFSNLTNLKKFRTLTCTVAEATSAFNEMSLIKTVPLEEFIMRLWSVDLPAETFEQFGQNYKFLKHLEIKLGTWHKLNFFMRSFPQLETLKIRFGEANRTVGFSDAYEDDGFVHKNIRTLSVEMHGSGRFNSDLFFKMIRAFPNLEKFSIQTVIPFTDDFFHYLVLNLGKIRELKIWRLQVEHDVIFKEETIEELQKLSKLLKFGEIQVCNIEDRFNPPPEGQKERADFAPLIEGLKDYYAIKQRGIRTCVRTFTVSLIVGKASDW